MIRSIPVLILAAAIAMAADEKPKRIAIADPKELKDDADFAIQGEYAGEKRGVQVIARGQGKFDVVDYAGGLPGAGWDGKAPNRKLKAKSKDGKVEVYEGENLVATIIDGAYAPVELKGGQFKKTERKSPTIGAKPPKDAVVLFGEAGDEKNWSDGKIVELSDGKYLNNGIKSKAKFGAFKLHVEFRLPWMPNSTGQQRGNSGVYLQDRYELQVLDSFGLKGEDNECGGIYTLHKPKVNACLPPLAWQTYDIDFTPATFVGGKKTKTARVTIEHNGIVIHEAAELKGPTGGGQNEDDTPGPIQFQDHGDPVVYRNVWIAEKK